MHRTIHIHPAAPAKPALGQPCNGCGLCCLAQPCPLGMLVSLRRTGACSALRWSDAHQRYQCGMVSQPIEVLHRLPQWLVRPVAGLLAAAARRWIAAGQGCDADVEVVHRT